MRYPGRGSENAIWIGGRASADGRGRGSEGVVRDWKNEKNIERFYCIVVGDGEGGKRQSKGRETVTIRRRERRVRFSGILLVIFTPLILAGCEGDQVPSDPQPAKVEKDSTMADGTPEIEVSEAMWERIQMGLELGFAAVGDADAFAPYAVFRLEDEIVSLVYAADGIDEALTLARSDIRKRGALDYALGYDGRITFEGEKYDAIVIEAAERGMRFARQFAHRYDRTDEPGKPRRIGRAIYLGEVESALAESP